MNLIKNLISSPPGGSIRGGLIIKMTLFFISLSLSTLSLAQPADSLKYTILSPSEFLQKFRGSQKAVLIDVRKNKDYNKSRIKGAINIPYSWKIEFPVDTISHDRALFIYCYAVFSSRKAAVQFYDRGFHNIYSLEGGLTSWKLKKMPTERKRLRSQLVPT
jgi:thiosulfate sulfurtransferase